MKIAVVAPPFGQTGGPEISTIELCAALGHYNNISVSLFAPNDWILDQSIHHIPTIEKSIWNMDDFPSQTPIERRNFITSSQFKVLCHQNEFDLVHISSPRYAYAIASNLSIPSVTMLRNKVNERYLSLLKQSGTHLVALTHGYAQTIGIDTVIHNAIPFDTIPFTHSTIPERNLREGLVTIGRITDQKGIHHAINIARATQKKLTIIGRVGLSTERQHYFKKEVQPFVDGSKIIHIENLPHDKIYTILGRSEALLFPIVRPETFGRVIMESLACGTPIIGTTVDPLPELLTSPDVAFLSNDLDQLKHAVTHHRFDHKRCREYAEQMFSMNRCADQHLSLYYEIIRRHGNSYPSTIEK